MSMVGTYTMHHYDWGISIFLHFCISTFLHFCIYTFLHFYIHAFPHFCISAFMHFCISAFLHFCISAFLHYHISICISAFLHFCISAFPHFCISALLHFYFSTFRHSCIFHSCRFSIYMLGQLQDQMLRNSNDWCCNMWATSLGTYDLQFSTSSLHAIQRRFAGEVRFRTPIDVSKA